MTPQSSQLISGFQKKEAFSHLAFLDKKPKTSKNAISFSFSHMLILVARNRNCNLMSHQKNRSGVTAGMSFFQDAFIKWGKGHRTDQNIRHPPEQGRQAI